MREFELMRPYGTAPYYVGRGGSSRQVCEATASFYPRGFERIANIRLVNNLVRGGRLYADRGQKRQTQGITG